MMLNRDIILAIALVLLIAGGVGGFNYWQKLQEEKLDEVASLVYLYEQGKLKEEEVEPKIKGTPYYPYFLAIRGGDPALIKESIGEESVKKLFMEKEASLLYERKDYEGALKLLSKITEEDFNYPSATLLKAFIYEKKGDKEKAKELYEVVRAKYGNTYFSRVATARLFKLSR